MMEFLELQNVNFQKKIYKTGLHGTRELKQSFGISCSISTQWYLSVQFSHTLVVGGDEKRIIRSRVSPLIMLVFWRKRAQNISQVRVGLCLGYVGGQNIRAMDP
jgi:hypothetical protein